MKTILEYISINKKPSIIQANDKDFYKILRGELDRVGLDANLNHIDTSKITNMANLFNGYNFNGDISKWNVSNVLYMQDMFAFCKDFNCDISKWDVSNVTDMAYMFYECESFDQNISKWKIDNVKYYSKIFTKCGISNCYIPEKFKDFETAK